MLREVEATVDEGPKVNQSSSDNLEPFSPPTTPGPRDKEPTFFGENPFVSDAFVNMPARQFRDGRYDNTAGDPFQSMDPFSDSSECHSIDTATDDFVDANSPHELRVNDHNKSTTPESTFSNSSTFSEEPHNAQVTANDVVQQHSPDLSRPHSSQSSITGSRESLKGSYNVVALQDSLKHSSRSSPREEHSSSRESLGDNHRLNTDNASSVHSRPPSRLTASQDSLSIDKPSPRLSDSPSHFSDGSVGSTRSSPGLQGRRSERSSTASFQEVVVEERIEPMLQVQCASYRDYYNYIVLMACSCSKLMLLM